MKINNEIVKESSKYVSDYLSINLDSKFTYHNLSHTMYVVKAAEMIASSMKIESHQKKILLVAAWFHDTGYTRQTDNHETAGASIAEKFLVEKKVDDEDIEIVKSCILATRCPQKPDSILQSILCDADMMHLSDKAFMDIGFSLRMEWEMTKDKKFTDEEWYDLSIQFVTAHRYHTSFAVKNLEEHKNKNLKKLYSKVNAATGKTDGNKNMEAMAPGKGKKNEDKLERGVETLFRTASSNHMKLSGMADNKAHILLSINSIIISIILSVLARKLTDATYLVIPTILLLCISVITIVFAVLTTKPKISKGVFTREQITKREVNLLFFGNFHQMDLGNYEWAIQEMMYDKEYLYKSMTKDIYFLGKVLARKYHYLNIGYRIFMYGLLSSIVAYAISFLIATHGVHG